MVLLIERDDGRRGECRARSDFTYVQADLVLHSPKIKSMVADCRICVIPYPTLGKSEYYCTSFTDSFFPLFPSLNYHL